MCLELIVRRSQLISMFLVGLAAVALGGCSLFNSGQDSPVLFAESFDANPKQMDIYTKDTGSAGVVSGEFQLRVFEPNYMQWALVTQQFTDTVIEVQARKVGGPDDNLYGVVCRYQDAQNFYYLVVSSDGYYAIGGVIGGIRSLIGSTQMQPSDVVLGGTSINHLKVTCSGSTLSLEVNGVMLASVQDTNLADGNAGLLAGAFKDAGVDVRFDNLLITRPGQ